MVVARRTRLHVETMRCGDALAVLLGLVGIASACRDPHGDPEHTDVTETSAASDDRDTDDTAGEAEGCVSIDRIHVGTVAPAGVQVRFRVLGCDGEALPRIAEHDIVVTDRDTGERFVGEGSSAAAPAAAASTQRFTALVLDMSSSIFASGADDDVLAAAEIFIARQVELAPAGHAQRVAIVQLGRSPQVRLVQDFTADPHLLYSAIAALGEHGPLGSTDLYGAYMLGLERLAKTGDAELVERSMVLVTDGTHEAGDRDNRRRLALAAEAGSDARIYTVGVGNDYDAGELIALASSVDTFVSVVDIDALVATFDAIGERVRARADSNYAVGVCTPVSFGHPGLTIAIDTGASRASFDVAHGTFGLSGDTEQCAPQHIAAATLACDPINFCHPVCAHQQCGSEDGIDCGECDAAHYCDPDRLDCALSYAGPEPECTTLALLAPDGNICASSPECPQVAGGACVIECQSDAQCPPAPEGYPWLSPVCHGDGEGLCLLACEGGELCPAGARCVATGNGSHCLW
ncbi:MAG: VWA domain-containing protein [Deltaproteobacteria bacterium]|nr:VWA domain-containing protein [Nannocystaceae bacterium]